jgi:hypothetical protein
VCGPPPCTVDCGNPDPEIALIAQRILQAATVRLPASDVDKAARQCRAEEVAAGDTTQPCLSIPIFFPGYDAGQAATHDAKVIAAVPAWFQLTYMNPKAKETGDNRIPRDWYDRERYKSECPDKPSDRDKQCDEYPFFSTVEAGPAAAAITPLVLEEVPAGQNRAEGIALKAMHYDPLCKMATSTGTQPWDFPGSGTQKFLTVPLAVPAGVNGAGEIIYVGPPSFHICGSPVSGGGSGAPPS